MYEAVFRVKGDSPYSRSTAETNTKLKLWCNDHCDLLHVTGEKQDEVIAHVSSEVGVHERLKNDGDQIVITEACLKPQAGNYIEPYLVSNNCLLLPPWQYEDGAKIVHVLAIDSADLTAFYRDISNEYTVTVESKQELSRVKSETPVFSVESLLPSLSDRQREVFLTAHEHGYYEIPRGTTTTEIADVIGIGRRTVEHHLRCAEEKLADALVNHL